MYTVGWWDSDIYRLLGGLPVKTVAYTFDKLYPHSGAAVIPQGTVLIEDGVIRWLGPAQQCGHPAQYLGGVALPGFIDSHVHLTATGLDCLSLNAGDYSRISDLLEVIHELDMEGRMVRVWGFDADNFQEQRYPTRAELNKACANNLLWINLIDCHGTLVNDNSLKAFGISRADPLLVGRDNQNARNFFLAQIDAEEREQAIRIAADMAISRGVTTVHALEGGSLFHNLDIEAVLALQSRLPLDTVVYPQVLDVDWVGGLGLKQIGGCLPLDGSSGVYTAAMTEAYYRRSDTGCLYYSREEIEALVCAAQERDMQVAMHACGDAAIDLFLDAVEAAQRVAPGGIAHRVEHFELPRYDQVQRCCQLGVILSMQPAFDWFWGGPHGDYAYTQGPKGWQNANPIGWAIDAGLLVAGGSDSGVTPLNPLLGIHAALNYHNSQQRVDMQTALAMFTENGAIAARLHDRGRLEPGLRGDIVVLDEDLRNQPWSQVKDIGIVATICKGQIVWEQHSSQ